MTIASPIITLDNPDKPCYPGDEVTGTIQLHVDDPFEARSIFISWRGKTQTYLVSPFDAPCTKYYFKKSQLVWVPKEGNNKIPAGIHQFKFTIVLPADCLPTFHGQMGKTNYKIKIVIDRPRHLNIKAEQEFNVTRKLELPMTMGKNHWFFNVNLQSGVFFSNGPVTLKVSVGTLVFVPGQTIDLIFELINNSTTEIIRIFAKLYHRTHYHSRLQSTPCKDFYNFTCPLGKLQQENSKEKVRNAEKREISLAPFAAEKYVMPFTFPGDLRTPSFHSGLITHGYFMEIGFRPKGGLDRAMMCTFYMGELPDETQEEVAHGECKEDAPPSYSDTVQDLF